MYNKKDVSKAFIDAVHGAVSGIKKPSVDVMLSEESENLLESSLSRLHSKYQNHVCGAITAFKSTKTREENKAANKQLLAYLMSKKYSVTKVKGAYVQNFGADTAKEVGEESFFVANINVQGDDGGQLQDDLVKLGKRYGQESILIIKPAGEAELVGTSTTSDFLDMGQKMTVGKGKFGAAGGPFYSRVKGRQFAFESMVSIKMPESINGIRAMTILAEQVQKELEEENEKKKLSEAKPNRVFANLAKRPFEQVKQYSKQSEAESKVEELKSAGFDAKITTMKIGPKKKPIVMYNVWKREKDK